MLQRKYRISVHAALVLVTCVVFGQRSPQRKKPCTPSPAITTVHSPILV